MAAKVKRPRIVTKSKEEKAARAGLVKAAVLGVASNSARISTATRGAVTGVRLRQSGTNLSAYDMGKYSDTTAYAPPIPGGGSSTTRTTTTVTRRPPAKKPKKKPVAVSSTAADAKKLARRLIARAKREAARKQAAKNAAAREASKTQVARGRNIPS